MNKTLKVKLKLKLLQTYFFNVKVATFEYIYFGPQNQDYCFIHTFFFHANKQVCSQQTKLQIKVFSRIIKNSNACQKNGQKSLTIGGVFKKIFLKEKIAKG